MKKDKKTTEAQELSPEEKELQRIKRRKKKRMRTISVVVDRIFGVFLATGIMLGLAGLGLEYVLVKGPSPALRDTFVMTMLETRRFDFIANVFLSEDEVAAIKAQSYQYIDEELDTSLISLPSKANPSEDPDSGSTLSSPSGADAYGLVDEDGDGYILESIYGNGYVGYVLTILDPTRVFVAKPDYYGGVGVKLGDFCKKYEAIGGINGGGFVDEGGGGLGGNPQGLLLVDGVCYNDGGGIPWSFAGFDADGLLRVGYYTLEDARNLGIVSGVSFSPVLIYNGESVDPSVLSSGVNPRTAIAQRGDGAVIMLVIDGRQSHSMGATYQDVVDILLERGAVNACNMDGGSSTTMYLNGEYVNSCSSANGLARELPNAFLFR